MSEGRGSTSSERELEEHVAAMRYLIAQANKRRPNRHRDPALALKQLQEDFTRVQIVNKELIIATERSSVVDLRLASRSAEEINKRAKRLLENLELPEPEPSLQVQPDSISDQVQLKHSIMQMGWLIYYFAKNPIFKEADVIETTAAAKARGDLDQIVELSGLIKMGSERLGKKTGKSN